MKQIFEYILKQNGFYMEEVFLKSLNKTERRWYKEGWEISENELFKICEDIEKHCLSKQRVKEVIGKHGVCNPSSCIKDLTFKQLIELGKFGNDSSIESLDYTYEPICTKYQFVKYGDGE